MFKNTSIACSVSIGLHLVALLLVMFRLDLTPTVALLGDPDTAVVSSYVAEREMGSVKAVSQSRVVVKKEITAKADLALKASRLKTEQKEQSAKVDVSSTPVGGKSHGEDMSALLTLLHAAIQAHQEYPPSALQMEREGRVTVGFVLLLDGTIRDLKVLTSSGAESLDRAALLAVTGAVPFHHIDQYLSSQREYKIDVVFKLT